MVLAAAVDDVVVATGVDGDCIWGSTSIRSSGHGGQCPCMRRLEGAPPPPTPMSHCALVLTQLDNLTKGIGPAERAQPCHLANDMTLKALMTLTTACIANSPTEDLEIAARRDCRRRPQVNKSLLKCMML